MQDHLRRPVREYHTICAESGCRCRTPRAGGTFDGAVAAAVAQSEGLTDDEFFRAYEQPAGSITAAVTRRRGEVVAACIGGTVHFNEIEIVEI